MSTPSVPDDPLDRIEAELDRLKARLDQDPTTPTAFSALDRLLAVIGASGASPSAAAASGAGPTMPGVAASPPPTGGSMSASWGGWGTLDTAGLVDRLEGTATKIRTLVESICARIGATGYSIAVSVPLGFSVQINFDIPKPSGPGPSSS